MERRLRGKWINLRCERMTETKSGTQMESKDNYNTFFLVIHKMYNFQFAN